MFDTCQLTQPCGTRCEDHLVVVTFDERTVVAVADGAGGSGSGGEAARQIVGAVREQAATLSGEADWRRLLERLDPQIGPGETTAVIVELTSSRLCGASVGDSGAWLIEGDSLHDLTRHQRRKPLLGSGVALPVSFSHAPWEGLLLVTTDGLLNYVKRETAVKLASTADFTTLPRLLLESVRLPSGEYWDDVGIVVCRRSRVRRGRQRYEL